MTQTIRRKVLITEQDLPTLTKRALNKSEYGHRKLYDSCEWRPLTEHDFLLDVLRRGDTINKNVRHWRREWIIRLYKDRMWRDRYLDYRVVESDGVIYFVNHMNYYSPVGLAILTKTKE